MNKFLKTTAIGAALLIAPTLAISAEVSEVRDVSEFSRIVIESSADINVKVGETQRVEVFAEDDEIGDVVTEVRSGTLYVSIDNNRRRHHGANLEISLRTLEGIEIDGSGDISATNVDSGKFDIEIDGSGDVDLEGTCGTLTIDVSGSGDINSKSLTCADATVDINGSGDVDIYASNSLYLDINGSGDVTVYGDPVKVRPSINGSGDLRFADDK